MTAAQVAWLEGEIDRLNEELAPLNSFVLPGGSPAAAYLHLARTVCRRAERIMVELNDQPGEDVSPDALKYVNRLSDFCSSRAVHERQGRDRRALGAWPESVRVAPMVMPLYDDNPFKLPQTPVVSWSLIGFTIVAFILEFSANDNPLVIANQFGVIPAAVSGAYSFPGAISPWLTLFTYQFLHADIVHLIGNLIFLWVFADNVEQALGRWRFLAFYLLVGALAGSPSCSATRIEGAADRGVGFDLRRRDRLSDAAALRQADRAGVRHSACASAPTGSSACSSPSSSSISARRRRATSPGGAISAACWRARRCSR